MIKWRSILIKLFPFVLAFYFVGTFIPNIVSWNAPLQAFFTSGATKLVWRGFVALLYGGFMIVGFFVLQPKIDKRLFVISAMAFMFLLISPLFNLTPISFSVIDQWLRLVYVNINIGFVEIVGYYLDTLFSLVFLSSLFFVVPAFVREARYPHLVFYVFLGIMACCCLISYLTEMPIYISILKGDNNAYEEAIKSIFPSKNAFGAFLSQAVIIVVYMLVRIMTGKSSIRNPILRKIVITTWAVLASGFAVTLVFTFNKNGIGTMLVFGVAVVGFTLLKKFMDSKNKSTRKRTGIISVLYVAALSGGLIFVISNPKLLDTLLSSIEGRNHVVDLFFENLDGSRILVGFGHSLGYHIYSWSFMSGRYVVVDNLHNAFLTVLGQGGILYLAFYLGLIIYAFYLLAKQRQDQLFFSISISALISFLFASLFESTQLFLSGSSGSSLMSLLIISFPLAKQIAFKKEGEDFYELNIC